MIGPVEDVLDAGADEAKERVVPARVEPETEPADEMLPLGAARAQVHENYVISQTEDGIVIVDAHAAHERLVYERLKQQMAENGVTSQALLVPEIVDLGGDAVRLLDMADELARLGLVIEAFGTSDPGLAMAANVWRNVFDSPEQVYREGIQFIRERISG